MNERFRPNAAGELRPLASGAALLGLLLLFLPLVDTPASADEEENSCIACHSDPDLLVRNKKLYDYFRNWSSSVHKQEEVSCEDCHGGYPEFADKDTAHGGNISGSNKGSAVNFRNVPETCGQCHDDILEGFRKSEHFKHLVKKKQEEQGPTCVTCHGSVNEEILKVSSVAESCARCHNEEKDNHPENPKKAEIILNRFLSIHRFYRYISKNATPEEAREFFVSIEERLRALSVTWHTFDLEGIDGQTQEVLATLKAKRDEVRGRKKQTSNQPEATP